jgi:hypothetical protein
MENLTFALPAMDLRRGFTLDDPPITIPWNITAARLIELGGPAGLEEVTRGYYVAACKALGGLDLKIGFHFDPGERGKLREIELFPRFAMPIADSYPKFQAHLEKTFGPPTKSRPGDEGFACHTWKKRGAEIRHFVFDRFGPEEHVRITKRWSLF